MATVSSVVVRPSGQPYSGARVTFRRSGGVSWLGSSAVADTDLQELTDAGGFFTLTLLGGYYWVWVGSSRPFSIHVPNDGQTYLLVDLRDGGSGVPVTGPLASQGENYRINEGALQLLNGTNGAWHPVWIVSGLGAPAINVGNPLDEPGQNFRITELGCLQLRHPDAGTWHAIRVLGSGSGVRIELSAALEDYANFRALDGALQLLNTDTEFYHTIFVVGSINAEAIALGPES